MKKSTKLFLSISGICALAAPGAWAESFKILGSRPLGMGGAFVAVAEDGLASYWNPAGIAGQANFDAELAAGARMEFTNGLLKDANTVSDLASKYTKVQDAQKNGTAVDADQMSSIFRTASVLGGLNDPGKGVLVEAQGGLNLRIMRMALTVNNYSSVGGTPFADTVNLGLGSASGQAGISFTGANTGAPASELTAARNDVKAAIDTVGYATIQQIVGAAGLTAGGISNSDQLANALVNQASASGLTSTQIADAAAKMKAEAPAAKQVFQNAASGNSYSNNTSNVTLRGISMFEVGLGYAHRFFLDDLYVGGNLKMLVGRVGYFKEQFLKEDVEGKDTFGDLDKNTKQTVQPGVDVGVLFDKREKWRMKFGLVGKNLNSPKFDQPAVAVGEPQYRVEPQVRAGAALYPFKSTFWVLAADMDLTNNITPVPGFTSRMLALGTELNLVNSNNFNLALRAGVMNNVAESDSKATYTGGLGLRFFHFFVDLSGAVSSKTEEVKSGEKESQKVPQNGQVSLALGLNF